jgi:aminopeptidase N
MHRPSRTFSARLLALILVLSQLPALAPAQQSLGPSVPAPNWTRSRDYDVQHYRLNLSFDWNQKTVSGDTTITLRPFRSDFRELTLDAGAMTIKSVTLGAGGKALQFKYEDNERLRVALDRAYSSGEELSVTVAHSAAPKRGLVFITPNEDDPTRPYQIWTGGEAENNHYWFPCYDYPNDFATSEMNVTVEDKFVAVSNGRLMGVDRDAAKKTATYRWKMEQPHASYLITVAVGEFTEVRHADGAVPVSSWVPKNKVEEAKASFGKLPAMLRFFEEKTGVAYPYAKYAQILVRDFPGALENVTATAMYDSALHDKRALLDVSSDEIVAHELAHQWFGDLVTCRDWSELWLNEGFAVYFAHLFDEQDKGREDMLYGLLADQRQYINAWSSGNRRPVVTNRYDDPDALFDVYAYPRAGAVLHMLRTHLGDELWWKGVNRYLTNNRFRNVETAQLKIAIEEATGQNLAWFFDQWVERMGHPELEVSYSYDEAAKALKLKVKQTQPAGTNAALPTADTFRLPVDIAVTTAQGERVERVVVDRREQEFTFAVDSKPVIVNFDRGNTLVKQLKFEKPKEELIAQAKNDADVMGRVWAVNELKKIKADDVAQALGEVLKQDKFYGVRVEAARALAAFNTEAAKGALMAGRQDNKSAVRREVIKGLAQFKDPQLAAFFANVVKTDQSYYAVADAARALGAVKGEGAYETLVKLLDRPSDKDVIRAGALEGLLALGDPRALDAAAKYAASPHVTGVRVAAIKAALALGKGDEQVRERLLGVLTKALKTTSLQLKFTAVSALAQIGDARAVPALEASLADAGGMGPTGAFYTQAVQGTIRQIKARAAKQPLTGQ